MRFADYLTGVGRTVAYYPSLVPIAGSVTATVLLCQLAYWTDKEADPDGWIFKTRDELKAETGLTRYEQEGARKQLTARGLMEEELRGLPAKLFYRLRRDAISDAWEAELPLQGCGKPPDKLAENPPASWGKTHQQGGGKPTNIIRKHQSTTEMTSESTAGDDGALIRAPAAPPHSDADLGRTISDRWAMNMHIPGEPRDKYRLSGRQQQSAVALYYRAVEKDQEAAFWSVMDEAFLGAWSFKGFVGAFQDELSGTRREKNQPAAGRAGPRPGSRAYQTDWSDVSEADVEAWNRTNGSTTAVLDVDDDLLFE